MLLDENAGKLNDAAFAMSLATPGWVDWPGSYHAGACGLAFADGHSETHRWHDPGTLIYGQDKMGGSQTGATGWQDWQWLADRTSARAN